MAGLEKLTAEEESRLRDARAQLDLEQAAGAQDAAAQARQASAQSMQQGVQGAISIGSQVAQALPLYAKSAGAMAANKLENQYNKLSESNKLGPDFYDTTGKALPFQQAISKLPGYESYKGLAPDAFNAQFNTLDPNKIRALKNQFLIPEKYGNMQTITPVSSMFNIPAVQYNMPSNYQHASYDPSYISSVFGQ
jgi:hypothetical protein